MTDEQEKLVTDNIALVHYIIRNYITIGEDEYTDLFQIGCMSLCEAALRFKPELGFKFATYASSYIIGRIKMYKRKHSSDKHGIKIGERILRKRDKVTSYAKKHKLDNGDTDVISSIMEILNIKDIGTIRSISLQSEVQLKDDSNSELSNLIASSKDEYDETEFRLTIYQKIERNKCNMSLGCYNTLKKLMDMHFRGEDVKGQKALAKHFGLTQATISRYLKKLKQIMEDE